MSLKIASCQPICEKDTQKNIDKAITMVEIAKKEYGAQLVIFPEQYPFNFKTKEETNGPYTKLFCDVAKQNDVGIILGKLIREGDSEYNSALAIDKNGLLINRYDKMHDFANGKSYFKPKCTDSNVFAFEGYNIGLMICYDVLIPEVARLLTLKGADVLVGLSNIPERTAGMWRHIIMTRSFENNTPIVNSSMVNERHGMQGATLIFEPPFYLKGEIDSKLEGIVFAEIFPENYAGKKIPASPPNVSGLDMFAKDLYGPFFGDVKFSVIEEIYAHYKRILKDEK